MYKNYTTQLAFLLILSFLWISGCADSSPVQEFQPDINRGGRAVAVAMHPTDFSLMIAASETGGLFETTSAGRVWNYIEGLPSFLFHDVAYSPANPEIVIATSAIDTRVENSGGIWVSTNRGATWSRPPGSSPESSSRCAELTSAYGIAFVPDSSGVYVGTDCGLAFSPDGGATWEHTVLDPTLPIDRFQVQDKVLALTTTASGYVYALAKDGIWVYNPTESQWTKSENTASVVTPGDNDAHRIAVSPLNDGHVFIAQNTDITLLPEYSFRRQAIFSLDHGATWRPLCTPGESCSSNDQNRVPLIKVAHSINEDSSHFDVYFGNGVDVYRRTFKLDADSIVGTGTWTKLMAEHGDISDIGFDFGNRYPRIMTGDGGVLQTTDEGATWFLEGNGLDGFAALQINEVTGSKVLSSDLSYTATDLYFATQDNSIWASQDDGLSWPRFITHEGISIEVRSASVERASANVTGWRCCAGQHFNALPGFTPTDTEWIFPITTSGDTLPPLASPFFIRPIGDIRRTRGNYRMVLTRGASGLNTAWITADQGETYDAVFNLVESFNHDKQVVGPSYQPIIYMPVVRRSGRIGLLRVTGLFGDVSEEVLAADGSGLNSIARFPTMWAWYAVFGANPHDPNHLIAADAGDEMIKVSRNGGLSWSPDPVATDAVTNSGALMFSGFRYGIPFTQAHVIRFDPVQEDHILIGTEQNGVLRSTNGGDSWSRVEDSEQIPNISDIYFHHDGTAIVASYGRGLWKLVFGDDESNRIVVDPEELERLELSPFTPSDFPIDVPAPEGLYVYAMSARMSGGMASVFPGESVQVFAHGVRPQEEAGPVSFSLNGSVIDQAVNVNENGLVADALQINALPGQPVTIRLEQGSGDAYQWSETVVLVTNRDEGWESQ